MAAKKSTRRYWLVKSEPDSYSWQQLERDRRTHWNGVRNYQARNMLRDDLKLGDGVLFYHSNAEPPAIVGIAKVVREGYPDHTQFDAKDPYYDDGADPAEPRWFMVDIECVSPLREALSLARLKQESSLAGMVLLQKGSRLSVQPVTAEEWRIVCKLGGVKEDS
jgi:predicted RNA-binding protein with PUA-like domain